MQAARIHSARQVDELIVLDIEATLAKRGPDMEMVRDLSETCFIPITVGGGVRTVDDVNNLLKAGADKVAICSAAQANQFKLIQDSTNRFGCQAIVGVVEYRDDLLSAKKVVTTHCGTLEHVSDARTMAMSLAEYGAGEIMLNSISRDGMMTGLDIDLIKSLYNLKVPMIVSGGCGSYDHILEAFQAGADAVATGAMLQFTDQTPRGAAEYLKSKGVEVRLETHQESA